MRLSDPDFPPRICELPRFEGPFDAFRLEARGCEVLFASYPAGSRIAPHSHATENCGVVTRFEVETSEIEFWFRAREAR